MLTRSTFRVARRGMSATAVAGACLLGMTIHAMAQAPAKTAPKANSVPDKPAEPKPAKAAGDEAAIRASGDAYKKAFNKADAKALAAAWTEDGQFVDETGRSFKGRDEIEKEFAAIFADQPAAEIDIEVDSIKFLTPEVAVESGTTRAHSATSPAGPPVKYTAVLVKSDGKWLLSNVSESRPAAVVGQKNLAGLNWLVGEWKAEMGGGKTYRMSCQWMPDKTFLSRTFSVTEGKLTISSGTQVVGWNPLLGQITSWTFDSTGGFGHGMWEDHGNRWRIDASSVMPDGATSLATNLLTKIDDNAFTWRSVERSLNEQLLPDTAEVRVERVSQ